MDIPTNMYTCTCTVEVHMRRHTLTPQPPSHPRDSSICDFLFSLQIYNPYMCSGLLFQTQLTDAALRATTEKTGAFWSPWQWNKSHDALCQITRFHVRYTHIVPPTHKIFDKCSTGVLQRLFQSRNIVWFSLSLCVFVIFKQQVLHDVSLTG